MLEMQTHSTFMCKIRVMEAYSQLEINKRVFRFTLHSLLKVSL